jgi:hypothetical protein
LLWSADSPEARKWADSVSKEFAENGALNLSSLQISAVDLNDDTARVLLDFEMVGVNLKTGESSPLYGKMRRVLRLKKTGRRWNVWSYGTEQDDLAARLEAATSFEAREKLLQSESSLVNKDLISVLQERARSPYRTGGLGQSEKAIEAAAQTAKKLLTLSARRAVMRSWVTFMPARNFMKKRSAVTRKPSLSTPLEIVAARDM